MPERLQRLLGFQKVNFLYGSVDYTDPLEYFKKNNIAFIEYDIETDKSANRRHKAMGARGVPVILFKDKRMNGFSESGFRRIYEPDS